MASWFEQRRRTRTQPQPEHVNPPAWDYNAPTSDNTSRGPTALVAAAARVVTGKTKRTAKGASSAMQTVTSSTADEEVWRMYDEVGELRYIANAISGRCAQAILYVEKDGLRVENSEDEDELIALITPQMIERTALNVYVAGSAYLVGLPVTEETEELLDASTIAPDAGVATGSNTVWFIASRLEVKSTAGKTTIRGEEYDEDKIYCERIWDPHPAQWDRADSPVLSCLPVLRELVGLTQHVSAQIDSRLAGAGVYWLPNSILNSAKVAASSADQQSFAENPVLNAIMQGMLLPIEDRSNASAIVPVLMGAPDESISKIRYDTFSTPFDKETHGLREEAIRRLGLGLDAPPELLQGMGDANHWGMWLVRDEVIQTHVVPRLDLIADALTHGFYRPIKKQQGDPDPDSYELKFDVSHLVQRPNRLADASSLHAVGAISDKALREAAGFEETDAPDSAAKAVSIALSVAQGNPQLIDNMPEIVKAVMALLDGTPETGQEEVSSQRLPDTLKPIASGNKPIAPPPKASAEKAPVAAGPVLAPNATPVPAAAGAKPTNGAKPVKAEGAPSGAGPVNG